MSDDEFDMKAFEADDEAESDSDTETESDSDTETEDVEEARLKSRKSYAKGKPVEKEIGEHVMYIESHIADDIIECVFENLNEEIKSSQESKNNSKESLRRSTKSSSDADKKGSDSKGKGIKQTYRRTDDSLCDDDDKIEDKQSLREYYESLEVAVNNSESKESYQGSKRSSSETKGAKSSHPECYESLNYGDNNIDILDSLLVNDFEGDELNKTESSETLKGSQGALSDGDDNKGCLPCTASQDDAKKIGVTQSPAASGDFLSDSDQSKECYIYSASRADDSKTKGSIDFLSDSDQSKEGFPRNDYQGADVKTNENTQSLPVSADFLSDSDQSKECILCLDSQVDHSNTKETTQSFQRSIDFLSDSEQSSEIIECKLLDDSQADKAKRTEIKHSLLHVDVNKKESNETGRASDDSLSDVESRIEIKHSLRERNDSLEGALNKKESKQIKEFLSDSDDNNECLLCSESQGDVTKTKETSESLPASADFLSDSDESKDIYASLLGSDSLYDNSKKKKSTHNIRRTHDSSDEDGNTGACGIKYNLRASDGSLSDVNHKSKSKCALRRSKHSSRELADKKESNRTFIASNHSLRKLGDKKESKRTLGGSSHSLRDGGKKTGIKHTLREGKDSLEFVVNKTDSNHSLRGSNVSLKSDKKTGIKHCLREDKDSLVLPVKKSGSGDTLRGSNSSLSNSDNNIGALDISSSLGRKKNSLAAVGKQRECKYNLAESSDSLSDADNNKKCLQHNVKGSHHALGDGTYRLDIPLRQSDPDSDNSDTLLHTLRPWDECLDDEETFRNECMQQSLRNFGLYQKPFQIRGTPRSVSDSQSEEESRGVEYLIEYVSRIVIGDLVRCVTYKQKRRALTVDELSRHVTACVIDEILETTFNNLKSIDIESKSENIAEFVMAFITDNEILHKVINLTGLRMIGPPIGSFEEKPNMRIKYLKRELFRRPKPMSPEMLWQDRRKVLKICANQLMDCVADRVIRELIDSLNDETSEHLTAYVSEYIAEDILEELNDLYAKCINNASTMSSDSTSECETPKVYVSSTGICPRPPRKHRDAIIWKEFADTYTYGLPEIKVNKQSIFKFHQEKLKFVCMVKKKPLFMSVVADRVNRNLGANMRITIGDRCFHCISTLLKLYSPWFANRHWKEEAFEFKEEDVPAAAFELIYQWIRFKTPIGMFDALKVLQAARQLHFDILRADCWSLISQEYVREKVAFQFFLEAEQRPLLKDACEVLLGRVRGYFMALVGREEFKDLTLKQLLSLIERDSIGVNCEAEVFFAALRWLSKSKDRFEHIETVMKYVRFAYMPMPMLFTLRNMGIEPELKPIGTTARVMQEFQKNPIMNKTLIDAMTYISLHFQKELDNEAPGPNSELKHKLVYPRRWTYNPKCPYHKSRLLYPYQHVFTEEEFNNYVNSIQIDWLGDLPPSNFMLDVEFDGVMLLAPKLKLNNDQ